MNSNVKIIHLLTVLVSLVIATPLAAQINIAAGGTQSVDCGQTVVFTDPNPGANYAPNATHEITLCADGGNSISVEILEMAGHVWDIADGDFLTIYDGPDTNAPVFGSFNSANSPGGITYSTTIENTSQCMTLVFTTDGAVEGQGFEGIVSCGSAWQPYSVALESDPAPGLNEPGYIDICQGETIEFSVIGDYPFSSTTGNGYEQSNNNVFFRWSMGDGTINEGIGLDQVSHTYNGQFGYNVTVQATDPLGQIRTDTLKVRVSTTPSFQNAIVGENPMCLGSSTSILGGYIDENTFAGFDITPGTFYTGGISAGQFTLPDGGGINHVDTILIGGVGPEAVITSIDDFLSLCVTIEHSFLGDLEMGLTCPNGTEVVIFDAHGGGNGMFPGGCNGGATFLGDANDAGAPGVPGIGFEYCWNMNAQWGTICDELAAGNTIPVNTFQAGNAMPAGEYTPNQSFANFIGCPVEGPWVLTVRDNLFIDDGTIFGWTIDLNPNLYPDPEVYSPEIVDAFWSDAPGIIDQTDGGLGIIIEPETEGFHEFEFAVVDNFGCQYDTLISVQVVAPPLLNAGEDLFLACADAQLQGEIGGGPQPACNQVAGDYTYCYGNNENTVFTYCPDNPNDGITFLTLEFIAGAVENNWDYIWVYDGSDIGAPLIAGPITGNLAGQVFTATNDGCITFRLESDGSVSCQSGSQAALNYTVSCGGGPQFDFSWEPAEFLSDPTILDPLIEGITEDQLFTLTAFPLAAPQCVSSDQVLVSVGEVPSPGEDAEVVFCIDGADENLFEYLGGSPDLGGVWADPNGDETDGAFLPGTSVDGIYTYAIPACDVAAELTVETVSYELEVLEPDTTICQNGSALLEVANPEPDITYTWSTGAQGESITVNPVDETTYSVFATYGPGCTTAPSEFTVSVLGALQQTITPGGNICPGDSIELTVQSAQGGLAPYLVTWTSDYGDVIEGESIFVAPEGEGNWCSTLTDQCESTPAVSCVFVGLAPEIDATFISDTLGGCVPVSVFFEANAENTDQIESALWDFGNGTTSTNLTAAVGSYAQQGIYDVSYTVVSIDGCVFSHTETELITIYNQPFASFTVTPQTIVLPNTTAEFLNQSLGSTEFSWVINSTDTIAGEDLVYDFPDIPGAYPVTLFASNPWGCADSVSRQILVMEEFTLFVPNAFTPDEDGINEVFRVQGIDVDENHFELMIFNRWGEVVYRSDDYNGFWNGSYNNGAHYVPDGVYFYRIETRSKTTQDNKVVTGHVTIIR